MILYPQLWCRSEFWGQNDGTIEFVHYSLEKQRNSSPHLELGGLVNFEVGTLFSNHIWKRWDPWLKIVRKVCPPLLSNEDSFAISLWGKNILSGPTWQAIRLTKYAQGKDIRQRNSNEWKPLVDLMVVWLDSNLTIKRRRFFQNNPLIHRILVLSPWSISVGYFGRTSMFFVLI